MTDHSNKYHPHPNCLLCGNKNPRSLQLKFVADENGGVSTLFTGHHRLQGYTGFLHGGVIASLLDSAMTNCLFQQGINAVTGELKVRYKHPVPYNAELVLQAEVESSKRPLFHMKAKLLQGHKLMARATAKFMETPEIQTNKKQRTR